MSKKETILTYSLLAFVSLGIIIGTYFGNIGNIISTITTAITAIIGAIAVYIQMRKDKEISETEFLLEFSKFFYTFEGAQALEKKIDRAMERGEIYEWSEEDYNSLSDYMIWLDALSTMIINKTLSLKLVNNIFNYRFFTVVNNPSLQRKELCVYGVYYKSIFKAHNMWVKYRKALGQPILFEEYDLSKVEIYESALKDKAVIKSIPYEPHGKVPIAPKARKK